MYIFDNNLDPLQILIKIILGISLYRSPFQVKKKNKNSRGAQSPCAFPSIRALNIILYV